MMQVLVAITVFTGLILLLVAIVLTARTLLHAGGSARLTINGGRTIDGEIGDTLLAALDEAGVHLPTSCGGKGTCGLCRIRIAGASGQDSIPPVERVTLKESQIVHGFRLACQFIVRGDLEVEVPPELLVARPWQCAVLEIRPLALLIREIVLSLPEQECQEFPAGCYVIVVAPPFELDFDDIDIGPAYAAEWRRMGLHRMRAGSVTEQSRAYSLVNRPGQTDRLVLNVRLALPPATSPRAPPGVVSSYLFGLRPGDTVLASGYYGDFFVRDSNREIVLIGGGVGMAPLYAHVYDQLERVQTRRTISFWYGARSLRDLYYADEMERLAHEHDNFSWHVALSDPSPDDVWDGARGFVHEVIVDEYLDSHPAPGDCEYYLCGPPLMIKAVLSALDRLGVPAENIFFDDFGG